MTSTSVSGKDYWPEPLSDNDKWWAGGENPRYYTWNVSFEITSPQSHSYPKSTVPFEYSLNDVYRGDFVAMGDSGRCYRIIEITSKSKLTMNCVLEDVYRTQTFKFSQGRGSPDVNKTCICFNVDEDFNTSIDPYLLPITVNPKTVSYIPFYLSQIEFIKNPIFKCQGECELGDIIAIEKGVGFTKPTGELSRNIVGRVIGSTGISKEYIVEPISKHIDIISQVGEVGDVIYLAEDGETLTLDATSKPLYLKTRDAIPNISRSNSNVTNPIIKAGTSINMNDVTLTFPTETTMPQFIDIINNNTDLDIVASEISPPFEIMADKTKLAYGIIGVTQIPTVIEINGGRVSIETTTAGQEKYGSAVAIGADIVNDINNANISGITARFDANNNDLYLTNESGGNINISNISGDTFASDTVDSATGFSETNVSSSDSVLVQLTLDSGDDLVIRELAGSFISDTGISGSDNGSLPKGIFYGGKIREGVNYVVNDMNEVTNLSPFVGDGVHVLDSGNGEWLEMKYTLTGWVTIATEDSARTDADTLSIEVDFNMEGQIYLGTVSSNSRITNISVTVQEAFDDINMTLNIGDAEVNNRLISDDFVDLLNTSTYNNISSHVYSEETDIYVYVNTHSSTKGMMKIVVSYQ